MNKHEFYESVQKLAPRTQSRLEQEATMDTLLLALQDALLKGETVKLKEFGTFEVYWTRPRKIRTPNGKIVNMKKKRRVRFRPAKSWGL